jgi:hypothetical protein
MRRKIQGCKSPRVRYAPNRGRYNVTLARQPGDAGASMTIFLMLMALALVFVTLLMFRIGWANDMRTQAIRAADSAAIAAVTPMRDMVIDFARSGVDPSMLSLGWLAGGAGPGRSNAEKYARENNAELDNSVGMAVRPSGFAGLTMRAHVRTKECQTKLDKGGDVGRAGTQACTDSLGRKGPGYRATAHATAKLREYSCYYTYDNTGPAQLFCENLLMWSKYGFQIPEALARRVFEVDLVDDEESVPFTGGFLGGGTAPGGGADTSAPIVNNKECPGERVTKRTCDMRNTVMSVFDFPNGVGCFRVDDSGEHPKGRACDFMTDRIGTSTGPGQALGDKVANFAVANAQRLGIYYVIWKQRIFNVQRASEGWRLMEDRGSITQNHFDHVHISMLE